MRHSSGGAPSLALVSLAPAAAHAVDHSSVVFFFKVSLKHRKKEEKEARKVNKEQKKGGEGGMEDDGQGAQRAAQA